MAEKTNITFTQQPQEIVVSLVEFDESNLRVDTCLRVTTILKNGTPIEFQDHHRAFQGMVEIDFFIEDQAAESQKLELPEHICRRLQIILGKYGNMVSIKEGKAESFGIQCSHFVSLLSGMEASSNKKDWRYSFLGNYQFLTQTPEQEHSLQPGDMIFIGRLCRRNFLERFLAPHDGEEISPGFFVEKNPYHFAMYLGNGLYISKFGEHNIGTSNFQSLRDFYSSSDVFLVSPKGRTISDEMIGNFFKKILPKQV